MTDEIWLVDFGVPFETEPGHRRPALVVGPPQRFGPEFPYRLVVPLTTTGRGLDLHVEIEASPLTGIDRTSYAQCESLRSVSRRRLVHPIGRVSAAVAATIRRVLIELLDL